MIKRIALFTALSMALAASSCDPAADVAARNISAAADNFEVPRRITFYNGITDNVVLVTEGFCSLGNRDTDRRMSVTCKTGPNRYIRNFLGLSDNVFFVSEQLEDVNASEFHYRIVFRPQALIPDIDFQGSTNEMFINQNTDG
ncbi:beta-sandwich lipoprotein [Pararhodobacter sp.]|uniref:beta-sandwich lipoprotein n=1 Tax=Pararhodobacter sp. TaxID=2127056 RepID=UPI002FDE658E